jgi:hypothetical protein
MSAEPEKFHVGMIDFFSIILPGAILAYELRLLMAQGQLPQVFPPTTSDAEGWVVFAVSSYILGHFLFQAGSWLDPASDAVREHLSPKHNDAALQVVVRIKQASLEDDPQMNGAVNAFQWAKCRLALSYPGAFAIVQRFEADSKFFRSLAVVLAFLTLSFIYTAHWGAMLTALTLCAASLWRYGEQRLKSTRQAYWYLITLEAEREKPGAALTELKP